MSISHRPVMVLEDYSEAMFNTHDIGADKWTLSGMSDLMQNAAAEKMVDLDLFGRPSEFQATMGEFMARTGVRAWLELGRRVDMRMAAPWPAFMSWLRDEGWLGWRDVEVVVVMLRTSLADAEANAALRAAHCSRVYQWAGWTSSECSFESWLYEQLMRGKVETQRARHFVRRISVLLHLPLSASFVNFYCEY